MEFKHNTKQRIRTIQGLRSFKNTLPTKVKRIISRKGQIYSKTLDNWKYIVGDELFKFCYPKSFRSSNKLGSSILNIMVKRGHEIDVEYSKKIILDRMNSFFGYNVVEKIKLITFQGEKDKIKKNKITNYDKNKYMEKISKIKNNKIKNSLIELSKLYKKK
tara:strand:+ start:368 stop:850 length:483 start_codon:yes stop_codon:yes gene_type:complete